MKRSALLPALFAGVIFTAIACGDDSSNDNPAPPDVGGGGKSPTAGNNSKAGTAGKDSNNGGAPEQGDGGKGPSTGDGGEPTTEVGGEGQGGDGPVPQPTCDLPERGKDGCYNCPTNGVVEEFLNRCTEGDIVEFINADRLPLLEEDGSLPDLPN